MSSGPLLLFSQDFKGDDISPSAAILHPTIGEIFIKNDESIKLQKELFSKIQIAANFGSTNTARGFFESIDVSKVPFGEELRDFFVIGEDQKLFMNETEEGLTRLGVSFISRSADIQDRGNSYVIQIIGAAEILIQGYHSSEDIAEFHEIAQLVLLLAPPSQGDSSQYESQDASQNESQSESRNMSPNESQNETENEAENETENETLNVSASQSEPMSVEGSAKVTRNNSSNNLNNLITSTTSSDITNVASTPIIDQMDSVLDGLNGFPSEKASPMPLPMRLWSLLESSIPSRKRQVKTIQTINTRAPH